MCDPSSGSHESTSERSCQPGELFDAHGFGSGLASIAMPVPRQQPDIYTLECSKTDLGESFTHHAKLSREYLQHPRRWTCPSGAVPCYGRILKAARRTVLDLLGFRLCVCCPRLWLHSVSLPIGRAARGSDS